MQYNTFSTKRTTISFINHWATINKETNKFCGCMAKVNACYQSGITKQDKV